MKTAPRRTWLLCVLFLPFAADITAAWAWFNTDIGRPPTVHRRTDHCRPPTAHRHLDCRANEHPGYTVNVNDHEPVHDRIGSDG